MTDCDAPPTFAVIIPLFNKEAAIGSTVGSVLRQTRLPDELIIVDDGSSDESVAVARAALQEAPKSLSWKLISKPNGGASSARNAGVEASTSRYLAFLDGDDEWLPGYVRELDQLARQFPTAGILSVRLAKRTAAGTLVAEPSALPSDFRGIISRPISTYRRGYGILSSSSVAVRRDAFEAAGGFADGARRGEDLCLWLKLLVSVGFAHSARPLSIWRDEHSGAAGRAGSMPEHISFFLGTAEGRGHLCNRDLAEFIDTNLPVQVASVLLVRDRKVAKELCAMAKSRPFATLIKCYAALAVPHALLMAGVELHKRISRSRVLNRGLSMTRGASDKTAPKA